MRASLRLRPSRRAHLEKESGLFRAKQPTAPFSVHKTPASSVEPTGTPLPPKNWPSDLRARIGKCIMFGCSAGQVAEAGALLGALTTQWRRLSAGSEGYLTGGRRGLGDQQVVWGDQDSFQHVNNVQYVRWAEASRVNWVMHFAVHAGPADHRRAWSELMTPRAVGLILKSIRCDFKLPVTYPDKVSVYHKLRSPPSAAPSPTSLTLDAVVLSHLHRRVAARLEEDVAVYDYRTASKTELRPFMKEVLEATFRLQEEEKIRARKEIWKLIGQVEELECTTWNRPDAVEDLGVYSSPNASRAI